MIVGLTGLAGSGKSEVARSLLSRGRFQRLAFADPLKSMLGALGLNYGQLYGGLKEEVDETFGVTPRFMMQTLGTEWGRNTVDPDIWLKAWQRKAHELTDRGHSIVADDVRFPNEVDLIHRLGGIVVRVERLGVHRGTHASETQELRLSEGDWTFLNYGTVDDIGDFVDLFLAKNAR